MNVIKMTDLDLKDKRVLIREDLNVPMQNGEISGEQRILSSLPTIKKALEMGAAVIVMSHLGNPKGVDPSLSLAPVAKRLSELLGKEVTLIENWLEGVNVLPGQVVLCENVRFQAGEKKDDEVLAQKMAALCDVYVMDAFGTSHRAHASTHGVAKFAKVAAAGPLLVKELEALAKAVEEPKKPVMALVGGAKVSTKIKMLNNLLDRVDRILVGGGIANTFLKAAGHQVGKSLVDEEFIEESKALLEKAKKLNKEIPLALDVVVTKDIKDGSLAQIKTADEVSEDEMIVDLGPETVSLYKEILQGANTVLWNGPMGVFEVPEFSYATKSVASAIAESDVFSMAGGGDTVSAIEKFDLFGKISYISTAGGAFLQYLEGASLPAVAILEERAATT